MMRPYKPIFKENIETSVLDNDFWFFDIVKKYKIPERNYEIIEKNGKSQISWIQGVWNYPKPWENGIWYDGIWKDGIWKNGIWKNGVWLKGIWKNGVWKNGEWKDGIWENGVWENGVWMNGVWKKGVWEKGWIYDPKKKGNYEFGSEWKDGYVLSPVSPKEYFGK